MAVVRSDKQSAPSLASSSVACCSLLSLPPAGLPTRHNNCTGDSQTLAMRLRPATAPFTSPPPPPLWCPGDLRPATAPFACCTQQGAAMASHETWCGSCARVKVECMCRPSPSGGSDTRAHTNDKHQGAPVSHCSQSALAHVPCDTPSALSCIPDHHYGGIYDPQISESRALNHNRAHELLTPIVTCSCGKRNGLQDKCRLMCAAPNCINKNQLAQLVLQGQAQNQGNETMHQSTGCPQPHGSQSPLPVSGDHNFLPLPLPLSSPAQTGANPCAVLVPYNPGAPANHIVRFTGTAAEYQQYFASIYACLNLLNQYLWTISQKVADFTNALAVNPTAITPPGVPHIVPPAINVHTTQQRSHLQQHVPMTVGEYTQLIGNITNYIGELQNRLGYLNSTVYNPNNVVNCANGQLKYCGPPVVVTQPTGGGGIVQAVGGAGSCGGGDGRCVQLWHAQAYPQGVQQAANAQHHSLPGAQAAWQAAANAPAYAAGPEVVTVATTNANAAFAAARSGGGNIAGTGEIIRSFNGNTPPKSCNGL